MECVSFVVMAQLERIRLWFSDLSIHLDVFESRGWISLKTNHRGIFCQETKNVTLTLKNKSNLTPLKCLSCFFSRCYHGEKLLNPRENVFNLLYLLQLLSRSFLMIKFVEKFQVWCDVRCEFDGFLFGFGCVFCASVYESFTSVVGISCYWVWQFFCRSFHFCYFVGYKKKTYTY